MNQQEKTPNNTKKFLFDVHNFDENEKGGEIEEDLPPPVFSQEELASAKNDAYHQGKKDGIAESQASFEKQTLDILAMIRTNFGLLFEEEERRGRMFEKESIQLACTIFARAFPSLNEKYGLEEVKAVLGRVLETVREEPEITIEIQSPHVETIQNHIDSLLRQTGGGPRCIVKENPGLSEGQCRMAWVNGTAARNGWQLAEQIRIQIEQVLADKAILTDNESGAIPLPLATTPNGDGQP